MPRPLRHTLALLAVSLATAQAAVEFTPEMKQFQNEGFDIRQATFKGETGSVTYLPPTKWELRGSKEMCELIAPGAKFTNATIRTYASGASLPSLDDAGMGPLGAEALKSLPSAAQNAKIVSQQANTIAIDGQGTYEFVLSYDAFGYTFLRSLVFARSGDALVLFQFSALADSFAALNTVFRRSLGTWQSTAAPEPKTPDTVATN